MVGVVVDIVRSRGRSSGELTDMKCHWFSIDNWATICIQGAVGLSWSLVVVIVEWSFLV